MIGREAEIPGVSTLFTGEIIRVPVPSPLRYSLSPEMPGDRQHFYREVPLMSNRLLSLLRTCGVDNLQAFPAILEDPISGQTWNDYQAVNVVGAVECVDFQRSDFAGGRRLVTAQFDGFVIDPARAGHFKFFRLAESISTLIANGEVRDYITTEEPSALNFVPTLDYAT
jgi:hypothetical protein